MAVHLLWHFVGVCFTKGVLSPCECLESSWWLSQPDWRTQHWHSSQASILYSFWQIPKLCCPPPAQSQGHNILYSFSGSECLFLFLFLQPNLFVIFGIFTGSSSFLALVKLFWHFSYRSVLLIYFILCYMFPLLNLLCFCFEIWVPQKVPWAAALIFSRCLLSCLLFRAVCVCVEMSFFRVSSSF